MTALPYAVPSAPARMPGPAGVSGPTGVPGRAGMPGRAGVGPDRGAPPVPAAALDLLDRARASLLAGCRAGDTYERFLAAHLGALRAAAALLAARSSPSRSNRPRSVWEVLPRCAPELTEWASFFAGSAQQRAAIDRGAVPTARAADDLLRQAEIFLETVQGALGVPLTVPLPDLIVPAHANRPVAHARRRSLGPEAADPGEELPR